MNEIDKRKILTADNNAYLLIKPNCFNLAVPPLLSGNDFQTAEEGSDVKLVCNVKSNPQPQMMLIFLSIKAFSRYMHVSV